MSEQTCPNPTDCCRELSRVWKALGVETFNGKSASENVAEQIAAARRRGREEREPPTCEHCGLPMVCASGQAELVHGTAQMHAETLTRAEAAEAEVARLSSRLAPQEKES